MNFEELKPIINRVFTEDRTIGVEMNKRVRDRQNYKVLMIMIN